MTRKDSRTKVVTENKIVLNPNSALTDVNQKNQEIQVHAKNYKSPADYLRAHIQIQTKENCNESFGTEIFNYISADYNQRLKGSFLRTMAKGDFCNQFPLKPTDLELLIQKDKISQTKKDLEKQIINLRLKNNAMLKSEYEEKMQALHVKWVELSHSVEDGQLPDPKEIAKVMELVKPDKVKSNQEMLAESKNVQAQTHQDAKNLVEKMNKQRAELAKIQDQKKKKQQDQINKALQENEEKKDQQKLILDKQKLEKEQILKEKQQKRKDGLFIQNQKVSRPLYKQKEQEFFEQMKQKEIKLQNEIKKVKEIKKIKPFDPDNIRNHADKYDSQRKERLNKLEKDREVLAEKEAKAYEDKQDYLKQKYPKQKSDDEEEETEETYQDWNDNAKKMKKQEAAQEQLEKMYQYDQYVKESCKPKISEKKKLELEMAIKNKSSPFARQDPHLQSEAMLTNPVNIPIAPSYGKTRMKEMQNQINKHDQLNITYDTDVVTPYKKPADLDPYGKSPDRQYNINWKSNKQHNRFQQQVQKPVIKEFHKDTVDYINKARNLKKANYNSVDLDIPLPKSFMDKSKSQYEKVDLIREQVKKIEKETKEKEQALRVKRVEQEDQIFKEGLKINQKMRQQNRLERDTFGNGKKSPSRNKNLTYDQRSFSRLTGKKTFIDNEDIDAAHELAKAQSREITKKLKLLQAFE